MNIKYGQLKKIILEDEARQNGQNANNKITKALSGPLGKISKLIDKIGNPKTIISVLRCVTSSENMMDAFDKLKQVLTKKNTEAKHAAQQQPAAQQNVEEGVGDNFLSRGSALVHGAKAVGTNVAGAVQKKVTGKTNIQHQNVYGSMQTGKFGTLIKRYIGKIQSLRNEMSNFTAKTQDAAAKNQTTAMISKIDEFVKIAQQSLADAQAKIKAAGGDRRAAAQQPQQQQQPQQPAQPQRAQVSENTKVTLTVGQIRRLIAEAEQGFLGKAKQYGKAMARGVANTARSVAQGARDFAKQAKTDISQGAKNLATTGDTRGAAGPARFAADLARIVGELEMDLKDLGWSERQNPQLAQVVKNMEAAANQIHGQGDKGHTTTWDKVRHGMGRMAGGAVTAAVQATAINALFGPLKQFMSPRMYAALVAFCTVLLRWYLKNFADADINADKRDAAAAVKESVKPTMTFEQLKYLLNEAVPPEVVAQAVISAGRAYAANDAKAGGAGDEDMSMVLTGSSGQKLHIGSDGMPEFMECKIRGRLIKIGFNKSGPRVGDFDYKSITDSTGKVIDIETLSGSSMRVQGTEGMLRTAFAEATKGKTPQAWRTYINDGISPAEIMSGAKSKSIDAIRDTMSQTTVKNTAATVSGKAAQATQNAGASFGNMGLEADDDAF